MKYKVVVTLEARGELLELIARIERRFGKPSALRLRNSFKQMLKNLAVHPRQYPAVVGHSFLRKGVLNSLTIVYYRIEAELVEVLSVHDGRSMGPDISEW